MDRVHIQDDMSEGQGRGQGGEGDHRPEGSFSPTEWEKGTPWKASWKRRHLSLSLKSGEASKKQRWNHAGKEVSQGRTGWRESSPFCSS